LRDQRDFREVGAALVLGLVVIAVVAVFETLRHWLVFESLRGAFGFGEAFYAVRGGLLRASGSLGHPIVLGYALVIALAMVGYLEQFIRPRWKLGLAAGALAAGLVACLSRGPWVGAVGALLIAVALRPGLGKKLARFIIGGGAVAMLLTLSPLGDRIVDFLPFVGTVEAENVSYRAQLFNVSMTVLEQHPIWGDVFYLRNPLMEQMRQGEGIIDMVNTYLQVALPYGLVGLGLFLAFFAASIRALMAVRGQVAAAEHDLEVLSRMLLAAMAGILVVIATVSSIFAVSTLYWIFAGFCCAFARVFARPAVEAARAGRSASKREMAPARVVAQRVR
jgi:O-antigen ligase